MDSKDFLDKVKDNVNVLPKETEDGKEVWCVKTEDALKAVEMAKVEAEEEIEDNTLYKISKGDFVTIYNSVENKYVVGKIERITSSAFYFQATNGKDTTYSRDNWIIKVEI